MHRDIMAGHNICNAIQGDLLEQQRPLCLQPKDSDGNYPWRGDGIESTKKKKKKAKVIPILVNFDHLCIRQQYMGQDRVEGATITHFGVVVYEPIVLFATAPTLVSLSFVSHSPSPFCHHSYTFIAFAITDSFLCPTLFFLILHISSLCHLSHDCFFYRLSPFFCHLFFSRLHYLYHRSHALSSTLLSLCFSLSSFPNPFFLPRSHRLYRHSHTLSSFFAFLLVL